MPRHNRPPTLRLDGASPLLWGVLLQLTIDTIRTGAESFRCLENALGGRQIEIIEHARPRSRFGDLIPNRFGVGRRS